MQIITQLKIDSTFIMRWCELQVATRK